MLNPEILSSLALALTLILGIWYPGALIAGCLFTYQVGALSYFSWIGMAYIAAAVLISAWQQRGNLSNIKLTSLDFTIVILITYLLISTAWSGDPIKCLPDYLKLFVTVFGINGVVRIQNSPPGYIVKQFLITCSILGAVISYCMLAERVTDTIHEMTRLIIGNEEATTVGLSLPLPFALVSCVLIFYLYSERILLILATACLALVGYCSIVSATRGVFVSAGFGLIVTLWLIRSRVGTSRFYMTGIGVSAFVVAALIYLPTDKIQGSLDRLFTNFSGDRIQADPSARDRLIGFSDAWSMFENHPILGTGYGSFGMHSFLGYPHNMFAEIGSTTGTIGIILLCAWLCAIFLAIIRICRRNIIIGGVLAGLSLTAFVQLQLSCAFSMSRALFLVSALVAAWVSKETSRKSISEIHSRQNRNFAPPLAQRY